MAGSCLVSLSSIVDVVLHVMADISLWKQAMQKVAPFVVERLDYEPTNLNFGGSQTIFEVGKSGDLLWRTALIMNFPGFKGAAGYTAVGDKSDQNINDLAGAGSITAAQKETLLALPAESVAGRYTRAEAFRPYYVHGAPLQLIETIEVRINQHTFDRHTGLFMDIEYDYSDASQRGLGSNLHKRPTVEALQDASEHGFRALVYLRFWHCLASQNAYPLVCHGNINFSVQARFRALSQVIVHPFGLAAFNAAGGAINVTNLQSTMKDGGVQLLSYQVFLHNAERSVFWDNAQDYVFQQTQRVVEDARVPSGAATYEHQLNMTGPIRALYWCFTAASMASQASFDTVTGYSWGGDESFANFQLLVNGSIYNDPLPAEVYRGGEAEAFGRSMPAGRYYAMMFALQYDDFFQTTGSNALSRAETVKVRFGWAGTQANPNSPAALASDAYLQLYAVNLNVMRVKVRFLHKPQQTKPILTLSLFFVSFAERRHRNQGKKFAQTSTKQTHTNTLCFCSWPSFKWLEDYIVWTVCP